MAVQSYLHDSLNRISVAAEKTGGTPFTPTCPDSGSVWCRQFGYDNAGNRSIAARTPSGAYLWDAGTFNSNNRIADPNWSYDNNGNVIKAPVPQTIGYDAENRQGAVCTQDPTGCPSQYASGRTVYVYDGLGNRVRRIDNTGTSMFVYDAFGNLAAEYGTTAAAPGTQYVTVDAVGSTRLLMTGTQASERHDFQPYGDEITGDTGTWRAGVTGYPNSLLSSLYAPGTTRQRFTGQERDGESGLDYFHARYFSGVQGRFTSPDPGNAGANPADPQSWNGYAYVGNNPMTFTDPSGLWSSNGGGSSDGGSVGVDWFFGLDKLFGALSGFFGGGGGGHADLSAVANTPVYKIQGGLKFTVDATEKTPDRQKSCGPARTGFGFGALAGGSAEAGAVITGASVQASVGAGFFVDGDWRPSAGAFASGGAVAYAGNHVAAAPSQEQPPSVVGAYGGYGPGAFITNAGSAQQLRGPFWTGTVNLGVGPGKASISIAYSKGVWVISAMGGLAPWSMGIGLSGSTITTTTAATGTSRCP